MKTFSIKPKDISRQWYLIDAGEIPLGRLATTAAKLLIGKGKVTLTSHIDGGDYVIVINADSLVVSGGKQQSKVYYRHSGFPGGLHQRTLGEAQERNSAGVITHAVRGMLPDNKLRNQRLKRLKVYSGSEHQHLPQKPITIALPKAKGRS